ncbi:MAG: Serine/threonine-protein kinase PrkC [Verrucomicrobiota bacterium]
MEKIGKYPVSHLLGTGATGEVWLGQHPNLDIPVAIKILSAALVDRDRNFVTRFINEARLAARLRHPNAVMIFDADSDGDRHFIVMEYISGGSVRDLIKVKGPLPLQQSLSIIAEVAAALDAAAQLGIVHRDIKPDNIMLDGNGKARLADLGIAKQIGADVSTTMTGVGLGTPLYLAPEQAYDAKNADCRSDLYSLGCTLFHMLTGKPPFEGPSAFSIMAQHANDPLPSVHRLRPSIPPELDVFLKRAAAKEPLARPQTPAQFMNEVLALDQQLRELAARPPAKPEKAVNRKIAAGLLAGIALASVVLAVILANRDKIAPEIAATHAADALPLSKAPELAKPVPDVIQTQPEKVKGPLPFQAEVAKSATEVAKPATEVAKPATEVAKPATEVAKPVDPAPAPAAGNILSEQKPIKPALPLAKRLAPALGKSFQLPQLGCELVYLAPGSFQMGSRISEAGRTSAEPLHEVMISEGFWIARTEVSVRQFAVFVKETSYRTEAERRGGSSAWLGRGNWQQKQAGARWNGAGEDTDLPVVHVSWNDAMRYCAWLNETERKAGMLPAGYLYSLPSEAQWEYAARAGTQGPWQGAARLGDIAVTSTEFAPAKIASKTANAWGLHDMLGNVWEWTLDASGGSDHLSPGIETLTEGAKDPVNHNGQRHVYRGGSWADEPRFHRCAMRAQSVYVDEPFSGNNHGFRLALIPAHLVARP